MNTMPQPLCKTPASEPRGIEVTGGNPLHKVPSRNYRTTETWAGCRLDVRATERESFTEYHLTGTLDGSRDRGAAADALFARIAAIVSEQGIQPIQEKLYGLPRIRADILKRREAQYRRHELDLSVPVTWIVGTPLREGDFVGLQAWGIVPRGAGTSVTTV